MRFTVMYGMKFYIMLLWGNLAHANSCKMKIVDKTFNGPGYLGDFGDYNGDGHLDAIVYDVDTTNSATTIYVQDILGEQADVNPLAECKVEGVCSGLIAVNLNSDALLDILLVMNYPSTYPRGFYFLGLYQTLRGGLEPDWDSRNDISSLKPKFMKEYSWSCRENVGSYDVYPGECGISSIHPLLADVNGDGLTDLIAQTVDKKIFVWYNTGTGFIPFSIYMIPYSALVGDIGGHIPSPHSSAFVDINGDCRADLVLVVEKYSETFLQVWLSRAVDGRIIYTKDEKLEIKLPKNYGQLTFADLNGDGTIDIILPHCDQKGENGTCVKGSKVSIYYNRQVPFCQNIWHNKETENCRLPTELCTHSPVSFEVKGDVGTTLIVLPSGLQFFGDNSNPITIAAGDLDNNGFPDLMIGVVDESSKKGSVLVYRNLMAASASPPNDRSFEMYSKIELDPARANVDILRVTTTDLFEDGVIDVLVIASGPDQKRTFSGSFYSAPEDHIGLFIKAMVKVGISNDAQTGGDVTSYGFSFNGSTFKITVIDFYGTKHPRTATVRAQSAHSPLQAPYAIFGLDKTNNYVEEFYLGMPTRSKYYSNMWISIIPNCTVISIPYRLFHPSEWVLKPSLSPSKKINTILFATMACLITLGIFILIFDFKEKREDSEQEKGFRQKFIIN